MILEVFLAAGRVGAVLLILSAWPMSSALGATDAERKLLTAAVNGDGATIRKLLAAGVSPDARDASSVDRRETPLMKAAWNGDARTARLLLKAGAKVDARDERGETALLTACLGRHERMVRLLLEAGASPRLRSRAGYSPLLVAADNGNVEIVRMLLARGLDVNERAPDGLTPLMAAAKRHGPMVKFLLARGARVDLRANKDTTALMMAAAGRRIAIVRRLLKAGAKVNRRRSNGRGLLHYTTIHQFMDSREDPVPVLRVLFQAGLRLEYPGDLKAMTFMLGQNYDHLLKLLISRKADFAQRDEFGLPVIYYAGRPNRSNLPLPGLRLDLNRMFLAASAGESRAFLETARRRRIPLDGRLRIFIDSHRYSVPKEIAERRANLLRAVLADGGLGKLRQKNFHRQRLSLMARQKKHRMLTPVLKRWKLLAPRFRPGSRAHVCRGNDTLHDWRGHLNRMKNIDQRDAQGNTLLFYAVHCRRIGLTKMLLRAGASPNVRNKFGLRPLYLAREKWTLDLLLRHGALVKNKKERTGLLCRMLYRGMKNPLEIIQALRKAGADPACRGHGGLRLPSILARAGKPNIARFVLRMGIKDPALELEHALKDDPRKATAMLRAGTPVDAGLAAKLLYTGKKDYLPLIVLNYSDPSRGLLDLLLNNNTIGKTQWENRRALAMRLLAAGYYPDARHQTYDQTVFSLIAQGFDYELADRFIKAGSDVNQSTKSGRTPLMNCSNVTMARRLLAAGARVDARDNWGRTALMLLARDRKMKMVKLLIHAGADVNARDAAGASVLRHARFHPDIRRLLIRAGARK